MKGEDLIKKVGLWFGTFDHHQVPRMETFEFPLIVDTILGRPGYQSVISSIIRGTG